MNQINLRRWSGQFAAQGTIRTIRRTIAGRIAGGECVVVYDDGAWGLTDEVQDRIRQGWPPDKVRFSLTHPVLGGARPKPRARRGRRRL